MIKAGAASIDISPRTSQFLYGYPHVPRMSTGVHDPLLSSALYLASGKQAVLFIANDVIFIGRELSQRARARIALQTGLNPRHILISATHTHSGPVTVRYISNEADHIVPPPDPEYLRQLEDGIVEAGMAAFRAAQPAHAGWCMARGEGLGTNRRDPSGPADPEIPVLLARNAETGRNIGCMLICAMHPTVLHEDSTVVNGDFPGLGRKWLQENLLGAGCPVVYHMGASGNQSPRYVTRANTLEEAARLGALLGEAVAKALTSLEVEDTLPVACGHTFVELVPAAFPAPEAAEAKRARARQRLDALRQAQAPKQEVRTAECDWFGAEETVTLARAAAEGRLDALRNALLPAELQYFQLGGVTIVGWPGEIFVEYALELRAEFPDTFIVTLANSDLQGYIVTPEAEAEGGYEASNAVFAAESGARILDATRSMLAGKAATVTAS